MCSDLLNVTNKSLPFKNITEVFFCCKKEGGRERGKEGGKKKLRKKARRYKTTWRGGLSFLEWIKLASAHETQGFTVWNHDSNKYHQIFVNTGGEWDVSLLHVVHFRVGQTVSQICLLFILLLHLTTIHRKYDIIWDTDIQIENRWAPNIFGSFICLFCVCWFYFVLFWDIVLPLSQGLPNTVTVTDSIAHKYTVT